MTGANALGRLAAGQAGYGAIRDYSDTWMKPWARLSPEARAGYIAAADAVRAAGEASDEAAGEAAYDSLWASARTKTAWGTLTDSARMAWVLFAQAVREAARR